MSETEKKGSAWPWIAVPVAAVALFFVLRECQHRLPPAEHAPAAVTVAPGTPPAASKPEESKPEESGATPAPAPAPQ